MTNSGGTATTLPSRLRVLKLPTVSGHSGRGSQAWYGAGLLIPCSQEFVGSNPTPCAPVLPSTRRYPFWKTPSSDSNLVFFLSIVRPISR